MAESLRPIDGREVDRMSRLLTWTSKRLAMAKEMAVGCLVHCPTKLTGHISIHQLDDLQRVGGGRA